MRGASLPCLKRGTLRASSPSTQSHKANLCVTRCTCAAMDRCWCCRAAIPSTTAGGKLCRAACSRKDLPSLRLTCAAPVRRRGAALRSVVVARPRSVAVARPRSVVVARPRSVVVARHCGAHDKTVCAGYCGGQINSAVERLSENLTKCIRAPAHPQAAAGGCRSRSRGLVDLWLRCNRAARKPSAPVARAGVHQHARGSRQNSHGGARHGDAPR